MRIVYDAAVTVPRELRPYLVGEAPRGNGEWDMFCPLHDDQTRSAQLNVDEGVWYCHACEDGGTVQSLLAQKDEWGERPSANARKSAVARLESAQEELSDKKVRGWVKDLLVKFDRLDLIQDKRGLWTKTICDFEIGWDASARAYTIPVRDRSGQLMNIRRYTPNPSEGRRKIWSVAGYGKPRLYPISALASKTLIICEGEFDALICIQNGFPAITRTASAGTWEDEWSEDFRDKLVYLCHDRDKAGRKANQKVSHALAGIAREIRELVLPYPLAEKHGKDLTDWWLEHDGDTDAFELMMKEAKRGKVVKLRLAQKNGAHPRRRVDPFELTDNGNARRFIVDHRGKLIYVSGPGWFRWSKSDFRHESKDRRLWLPTPRERIIKDVKRTILDLRESALDIPDTEEQLLILKHARRSLSTAALRNARDSAEAGDPYIPDLTVAIDQLDWNPDILNTANGIVDLETGKLRKHDPTEFCSMITRPAYNPKADRKEWQRFLDKIMPDAELQDKLQICMGASVTGRPTRALFILFGPEGENGKTQLVEAVTAVLGGYAKTAAESTFTTANAREAAYDLAEFRGVRFVSFAETVEGRGLASERVKRVTGDDLVKARYPYGKFFTYRPRYSLWASTNHTPYIPASEKAMWKRVWVYPMFQQIKRDEQISDYGRKLAHEHGEAILAWLVDGARAFYMNECRLGPQSKPMETQRQEWQQRDDIVGRWFEERVDINPRARIRLVDLWKDFSLWCDEQGEGSTFQTYTSQKFHAEMDQKYQQFPRSLKSLQGSKFREGIQLVTKGLFR